MSIREVRSMTKSHIFAVAFAVSLSPLALQAQPVRKPHPGPGPGSGPDKVKGDYTFRLTPATSFAPWYDGTNGKDSGVVTAPRQDILRVGTFTADKGNVTGHTIATTDDGLTTVVIDFTWSGTYTVNADGTGKLDITAVTVTDASCAPAQPAGMCATFEGPESYAFVVNNHGEEKKVSLIQTDNVGGGAKIFLTGEASRTSQDAHGRDDGDDDSPRR
jgi:hypothetical protein